MFQRSLITAIAALALVTAAARPASAVVVELHDGGRTIHGRLIRLTPQLLELEQVAGDGTARRMQWSREEIANVTLHVSEERLSGLTPSQLEGYFAYAEELKPLAADPDARHEAIRLYLIAGHGDESRFAEPALRRLIELARTADEERKFRAMLFIRQARQMNGSRGLLSDIKDNAFLSSAGVEGLLLCVRSLRSGDRRRALEELARSEVQTALTQLHAELTADEIQQIARGACAACLDGRTACADCGGQGALSAEAGQAVCSACRGAGLTACSTCRGRDFFTRPPTAALRKLLAIELDILQQRSLLERGKTEKRLLPGDYRDWSLAAESQTAAKTPLNWTNVTEIDPRQSVFVGDRWVSP